MKCQLLCARDLALHRTGRCWRVGTGPGCTGLTEAARLVEEGAQVTSVSPDPSPVVARLWDRGHITTSRAFCQYLEVKVGIWD